MTHYTCRMKDSDNVEFSIRIGIQDKKNIQLTEVLEILRGIADKLESKVVIWWREN